MRKLLYILILITTALPASATISVVATVNAANVVNSGTTVTTGTVNASTANEIVIVVTDYQPTAMPTISDNVGGNAYTLIRTNTDGANPRVSIYKSQRNPNVSAAMTFTASGSSFPSIFVKLVSSTYPLSVDQQNGTGATTGSSGSPGSITPSGNNELIITACNSGGSGAPTITSPAATFTVINQAFVNLRSYASGVGDFVQGTAASINPTWAWTGSQPWAALQVAFKENIPISTNAAFLLHMMD